MRRVWGLLLLFAGAVTASSKDEPPAGPAGAAGAPGTPGTIARTPEFQTRVDAAIDRGVAWLRKAQAQDGSFLEYPTFPGAVTALVYHTLRVCGVRKTDSTAQRAWTSLRRDYTPATMQTYGAAVYLMAIAEHGDRIPNAPDDRDVKLSGEDLRFATDIARALAAAQDAQGRWTYESPVVPGATTGYVTGGLRRPGAYDHSNTQYALLGLKSAARCGVPVDPAVWRRSLDHFLAAQEPDGPAVPRHDARAAGGTERGGTYAPVTDRARGWAYEGTIVGGTTARAANASMTAGGVSSVVICRSELLGTTSMPAKLASDSETAVWDGLAWIGTNWVYDPALGVRGALPQTPAGVPGMGCGIELYETYGIERAGVLAGVEWMADLDWYGAGAEPLLARQDKDGSWKGIFQGILPEPDRNGLARCEASRRVVDTCFALLFLKRGTAPVRRGAVTQTADATDIRFDTAATLAGRDFEDFVDLVLLRWTRAADDRARRALFAGATSIGPRIVEPLLVRLDSPDADVRKAADALLRHATGESFGFDAAADRAHREDAVVQWQAWWLGAKSRLRYDAATGRLVAD